MYNNDVGAYPAGGLIGNDNGKIKGCNGGTIYCSWGGIFSNLTKATYMVKLPLDPTSDRTKYYYEGIAGSNGLVSGYRLYTRLENLQDVSFPLTGAIEYNEDCGVSTVTFCNYVITSPNVVTPTPKPLK